jgi:hypothetical protein
MKLQKLITLLIVLVVLLASFGIYSALAKGPDSGMKVGKLSTACVAGSPAGWTCPTSVVRSGNVTTCYAQAVGPAGSSQTIYIYGNGTGGKALHVGSTYYGSSTPHTCYSSRSCSWTFTYTGSAQPVLCNWRFSLP